MSHPKTKKERIISRNKKRDRIKNINHYGYPLVGWPVYVDKKLQDLNYIRYLRLNGLLDDYYNMTGEFAKENYYIKFYSRTKRKKFFKHYANRRTRRRSNPGNFGNHKKNFGLWWELL